MASVAAPPALKLQPARLAGLKLALYDFGRRNRELSSRPGSFVIAANQDVSEALLGFHEWFRFVPMAIADHADACILAEPVRHDRPEPLLAQFEKLPDDGAVFVSFDLAGFPSHHREALVRELAIVLPGAICRVADLGVEARKEGLTPWVVVERRRPRCWLFIGGSGGGKTSAAIELGRQMGIKVFHGDLLLQRIAEDEWPADPALKEAAVFGYESADWSTTIGRMFRKGLFPGLADTIIADAAGADFCFEIWVPAEHRASIVAAFRERGYFPFAPGVDLPSATVTKR
jgi:hypothetical protein